MNQSRPETIADIPFERLNSITGLRQLDKDFLRFLSENSSALHDQLLAYRQKKTTFTAIELSEFLIALAPHIEAYVGRSRA